MAGRDNITKYSESPASDNEDINGLNIAERCEIANLNNAIRILMSHLAAFNNSSVTLTSPSFTKISVNQIDLGNGFILQTDSTGLVINKDDVTVAKLTNSGEFRAVDVTGSVNFN